MSAEKNIRLKQRVDTMKSWTENNPILLKNEIGYEEETGLYKIGDGETAWNDLDVKERTKGFKIRSFDKINDNIVITLETKSSASLAISKYSTLYIKADMAYLATVGDLIDDSNYARYIIKPISNYTMEVSSSEDDLANGVIENYCCVIGQPELGDMVVGYWSIAEGENTMAHGRASHAEGRKTLTCGNYAHAEGLRTKAFVGSHAEGYDTKASGVQSHAEGNGSVASGDCAHAQNYNSTASGIYSHAGGNHSTASGDCAFAHGYNNVVDKAYGVAFGKNTIAKLGSFATGYSAQAIGDQSFATGYSTQAIGAYSHVEGNATVANGVFGHAEGYKSQAIGTEATHAEGYCTKTTGTLGAHSEGYWTEAAHIATHAEGYKTIASGSYGSHAEGRETTSSGYGAHSEGYTTVASGNYSHAGGCNSVVAHSYSFAHGEGLATAAQNQFVVGQYNSPSNDAIFQVGVGSSDDMRMSAFTVDSVGDVKIVNHLKVESSIDTYQVRSDDITGKDIRAENALHTSKIVPNLDNSPIIDIINNYGVMNIEGGLGTNIRSSSSMLLDSVGFMTVNAGAGIDITTPSIDFYRECLVSGSNSTLLNFNTIVSDSSLQLITRSEDGDIELSTTGIATYNGSEIATVDNTVQSFILDNLNDITSTIEAKARTFTLVPDNIKITKDSYFICSSSLGCNTYSSGPVFPDGQLAHGGVGEWIQVAVNTNNHQLFIKINNDGTIQGYDTGNGSSTFTYPIVITVYPSKPTLSQTINVDNYIPDFDAITAKENPTTCIFKNLNITDAYFSIKQGSFTSTPGWANRLQLYSPLNNQPLTIKMYITPQSTGLTWVDEFNNLYLSLYGANGSTLLAIDTDTVGLPQIGETKCYTLKNVNPSIVGNDSQLYFGFCNQDGTTPSNGSGFFYITGIEIYQDLELNGSVAPNNEELVSCYNWLSNATIYYNALHLSYAYKSGYVQTNQIIYNEI